MSIRVTITARGAAQQMRQIRELQRRLQDRRGGVMRAANDIAKVWDRNFRSEGSLVGGWQPLAQATIERRQRQGFSAGPILVRYGALRAVVTEGFMNARGAGSWSKTDNYSGHTTSGRLTLSKDTATLEAHGWKVANQYGHPNWRGRDIPARKFWFTTGPARKAARDGVARWIVSEVIP